MGFSWPGSGNRVWDLTVNGAVQSTMATSNTNRFTAVTQLGRRQTSIYTGQAQCGYFRYTDNNAGANDRDYDSTLSSHAAGTVILSEVLNGFDGTGVGMPTDGSAWLDLGGGGGFEPQWATHANILIQ